MRRTKEDAQATRHLLLDAAEKVFAEKGVSRTSLNDIAAAAGTTRGAIYWHFKNKADLFNAMMDRVILPLEAAFSELGTEEDADPLACLTGASLEALRLVQHDDRVRRVFEVATHKVEYVEEQEAIRERHRLAYVNCVQATQRGLDEMVRRRGKPLQVETLVAANGLHALMAGLIQVWLLDTTAFDLTDTAQAALFTYLKGLGLAAA